MHTVTQELMVAVEDYLETETAVTVMLDDNNNNDAQPTPHMFSQIQNVCFS